MDVARPDRREDARGAESPSPALLEVDGLEVSIGGVRLLSEVSLTMRSGELVGLVGESGSGKTLTGLSLLGLLPPGAAVAGRIRFGGTELSAAGQDRLRSVRGRELSMIFQEPRASLHPARPVGKQVMDVLRAHEPVRQAEARRRAEEMFGMVGLPAPGRVMDSYLHELSGGMCQRVMIAMALVCGPRLLIAFDGAGDWDGIPGAPAAPADPPRGCRFHPRCAHARAQCAEHLPRLETGKHGGRTRCLRSAELTLPGVSR